MTTEMTETTAVVLAAPAADRLAPLREMMTLLKDGGQDLMMAFAADIVERQVAVARFDQDWRIATVFANSGMFADAKEINRAMAKIELGRSWSMTPADSMQHIYFVNGRPAVQNEYMAAKMRDSGLIWKIQHHRDSQSKESLGCTLWPSRWSEDRKQHVPITELTASPDGKGLVEIPASVSFMKWEADRIDVKENDKSIKLSEKSTYRQYGEDMYFWRAMGRLRRRYATNILSGAVSRAEADDMMPEIIEPLLIAPASPVQTSPEDFAPKPPRKRGTRGDETAVPVATETAATEPVTTSQPADAGGVVVEVASEATTAETLLTVLRQMRVDRGENLFVAQWNSLRTGHTVEGMDNMVPEKLQKAIDLLTAMGSAAPAEKRLF